MMKMKKAAAMFLAAVTVVSMAGCGKSVQKNTVFSVDDLPGKLIGVQLGTTGDVYASSFAGSLCRGKTLIEAARIAHEYVCESIRKTIDDKEDHWYGVKFEKAIPFLVSQLS